jgi:hypothetical protein
MAVITCIELQFDPALHIRNHNQEDKDDGLFTCDRAGMLFDPSVVITMNHCQYAKEKTWLQELKLN